jgi:hypothetical protein
MNPWLVFWAPQLHLPFGGDVAQRIEPNTNWFFDSIAPAAGDSTVERKAFEVASYGRQLGLITEVLTDITTQVAPSSKEGKKALERLRAIQTQIEGLKEKDAAEIAQEVQTLVAQLKRRHKDKYPRLRQQIERALAEGDA